MDVSTVGSHTHLHDFVRPWLTVLTSAAPEILVKHVSPCEQSTFMCDLDSFSYFCQIIFSYSLKQQPCLSCRKQSCFHCASYCEFSFNRRKSLEGGQLHLDIQFSTSQEACLSVSSSWVTACDLGGVQGGLRLQVLWPWLSGVASLCCLKFWQLCQQTIQAH